MESPAGGADMWAGRRTRSMDQGPWTTGESARNMYRCWLLAACASLVLLLGWAASAQAATVRMTSGGVVVDSTGDGDRTSLFKIQPAARTPSGEISKWLVEDLGGCLVGCVSPVGDACRDPAPGEPGISGI